jgi:hypothetical protein
MFAYKNYKAKPFTGLLREKTMHKILSSKRNKYEKMCTNLFRGKREDNSEWAYGKVNWGWELHPVTINKIAVIPETVGQYSNFKDKNGKKIFNSDILKMSDSENYGYALPGVMLFCFNFYAGYLDDGLAGYKELKQRFITSEVIGNIYENPELLKRSK